MDTIATQAAALYGAVTRAILAPSVHNTQPWRFVLEPNRLDVFADSRRRLTVLDPTGRQMYVSAGCALLNARASLAAAKCPVRVVTLPDPQDPELIARIEADADEAIDASLAALDPVVGLRQTNRRRFATDLVPDELVARLVSAAAAEGAILHEVVEPDDRQTLARLSQKADILQVTDPAYRAELRAWTSSDPKRLDGVPAAVVPHVDGTSGDEMPIRDFDTQGVGWLPAETRSSSGQCLLILGTRGDAHEAWVHGGQALERVWLEITRAGFVASLFTQVIEAAALREQLSRELRLGMRPHVVIRVGRAPVTPASTRRRIADVLEDRSARA